MPSFLFTPAPNKDAIRFLKDKAVVGRDVFDGLLPELRGLAFTITGVESMAVLKKARETLSTLPAGGDWDSIKKTLASDLVPYLGEEGGVKRAETLLRFHGYGAYHAAQDEVLDRQKDVYPFWQWQTAQDDRVRESHAALDGMVFPCDWTGEYPGQAFGCRCMRIPMSEDDAHEIRTADAKKPPEAHRVVEGDRAARAQATGQLATVGENNIPLTISVADPRLKNGGSGFFQKPGQLVDLDQLKAAYSKTPEGTVAFSTFEKWAGETSLGKGQGTVAGWLESQATRIASAAPMPPGERPWQELPPLPRSPGRASPVSAAIVTTGLAAPEAALATHALRLVDIAHDDGALPRVPLVLERSPDLDGSLSRKADGSYVIGFRRSSPRPLLTILEEVGHLVDGVALAPAPGQWGSAAAPALDPVRRALHASQAVAAMRRLSYRETADFLPDHELFARAYAQYVATRAADPAALAELQRELASITGWRYWSAADFAPIAAALEQFLTTFPWTSRR